MVSAILWLAVFIGGAVALAYRRSDLRTAMVAAGVAAAAFIFFTDAGLAWKLLALVPAVLLALLNNDRFRQSRITRPALAMYRKILPSMSDTEREALEAGTVWWEGELFSGRPDWNNLLSIPRPALSVEEQAFLDGPVDELCEMLNDWEITHELADLPDDVWQFLKDKGFFAMIIPREYGGLQFSELAHSEVLAKVSGRSGTAASTIAVPNSLGPAKLIHKYGTREQKDYYLPRLAKGEEIPCFGLTSPTAGSDATSLTDSGVVCKGMFEGKEVLGLRLNWNKRYITLAPVATVLGLAFKMYDPDKLLGDKTDHGITCALIPTTLPGVKSGRRHFPLNVPFQNGPIAGQDVFVPLDYIIGGPKMAGEGWRMLVECLTVGRCISLPSNAAGGAKAGLAAVGAYARLRRQFNMPIGRFEGIQEVIARVAGRTYIMEAARVMTAGAVDRGEEPAVPSAILKYHLTELGRQVANDIMDIHGGKGIMLGPNNYAGRAYQAVPVAITVEGANILTRSMIIFGQGAIRCHPYVLKEIRAAADKDRQRALQDFDAALFGHAGLAIANAARAFVMGLTSARFTAVPTDSPTRRFYQHINRFSAAFALVADSAMLTMGGGLKKREMISARLGDIISNLYLASAVLKRFEDQGRPAEDLPLVEWACRDLLYRSQESLHGVMRNFPNRWVAMALRIIVFPRGRLYYSPSDERERRIAETMIRPSETRARLTDGIYRRDEPTNPMAKLEGALAMAADAEPLGRKIRHAVKKGTIGAAPIPEQIRQAVSAGVLSEAEGNYFSDFNEKVMAIVMVDDFDPAELGTKAVAPRPRISAVKQQEAMRADPAA